MNAMMPSLGQEMHLRPAQMSQAELVGQGEAPASAALALPFAMAALRSEAGAAGLAVIQNGERERAVVVEPFFNRRQQLRLFAMFPPGSEPWVNGHAAAAMVVMSPGDYFRWGQEPGYTVALFSRPLIGPPPPAAVLGKACPVCRLPFAADQTCVSCACGAVLHCEKDEAKLQCAYLRSTCVVCRRRLVLTEGYVTPPSDEE